MYDWHQTPKTLTITIPLAYKIDSKKVDTTIAKNYIKLNIPEMKIFKFIDLFEDVDIDSSSILIEDSRIAFYLNKIKEDIWPSLEFKANNKEEMKERRKLAEEELNKKISDLRETASNKKKEFEKFVMDKSMKIEDQTRKELDDKKNIEKNQAESELYEFINDIDKRQNVEEYSNRSKDSKKIERKDESHRQNKLAITDNIYTTGENNLSESGEKLNIKSKDELNEDKDIGMNIVSEKEKHLGHLSNEQTHIQDNNIFDSKSIQVASTNNETSVRQQSNIQVNLTEKMIPHFAARESLSKEPPYPKSKKLVPEKNYLGQEIEDRNPIWIKEKADNFFKNKDYRSAINAYNRAIELDKDFHKCYLNRATSLLLCGEFDLALKDLNTLQDLISSIDAKEKEAEDVFYSRLLIKAKLKQFAIYAITSEFITALNIIDELLSSTKPGLLDEKTINKIKQDRELVNHRLQCEEIKVKADACVTLGQYDKAKELYHNILNQDTSMIQPNEKILSNLSLIAIQIKDYDSGIKYCTDCLKIIKSFKDKISLNPKKFDNFLEVKILLRRAECYVAINEMTKAQSDLEAVERFEIRNKEILEKFDFFKEKLKSVLLENYGQKANSLLKSKDFTEALEYYNRSISLIKKKEKIEQVKFYLNRCSCLIALGQFEKVEEECNRLISNLLTLQNIAIIKSDFNKIKNVKDLLFNTYVKRAYANTKSNKVDDAIKDYKLALEINGNDVNVKKNLAALEKII